MKTLNNVRPALSGAAMLVAALVSASLPAHAETWPSRTITTIVPLGAGSGSDLMARIVLNKVSQQIGQTIVVENRPGAGGTIGTAFAMRAPADGYTLVAYGALASARALYAHLPYDTAKDIEPVIPLGQQPLVVITSPDSPYKSLADLVAAIKAKPGVLNYASAGIGSASHFGTSRMLMTIHGSAVHVPYKGSADSVTEVMAGRVDFSVQPLSVTAPMVRAGKLRALAVDATARSPSLPDVPSLVEAGLPEDAVYPFYAGLFVSSKTPQDIVQKLHAEAEKALADPDVQKKLGALGVQPMPMSVEAFKAFFLKDIAANAEIAKETGIKTQ